MTIQKQPDYYASKLKHVMEELQRYDMDDAKTVDKTIENFEKAGKDIRRFNLLELCRWDQYKMTVRWGFHWVENKTGH